MICDGEMLGLTEHTAVYSVVKHGRLTKVYEQWINEYFLSQLFDNWGNTEIIDNV